MRGLNIVSENGVPFDHRKSVNKLTSKNSEVLPYSLLAVNIVTIENGVPFDHRKSVNELKQK
jgi:hypothetical protein